MGDHHWTFERVGGFDQPRITTGADLAAIPKLDQKLWVALACPVAGLEMDERTLALIDVDADGRVRAPELIAAIDWTTKLVNDVEVLAKVGGGLPLSAIDDSSDEGKLILRTAKELLERAGKAGEKAIAVGDVKVAIEAFEKQPFNGDGILPVDSATDDATKAVITDVLACTKPETDKGGKPGVTKATVEAFFDEVAKHAEWLAKGENDPNIAVAGADTAAAHAALSAVRAKVDDCFARQRLVGYDPRALGAMKGEEKDYLALSKGLLTLSSPEIAGLPLSQIEGSAPVPLERGINPAWAAKMADLRAKAIKPILGERATLSEADWGALCAKLAPHEAWLAAKAGASVDKLGPARIEELAASDLKAKVLALVADDTAKEPMAKAIEKVEKLVRCHRDLMTLANNFVAFRDFYDRQRDKAIFQAGTLYLDSRACDLTLRVADAGRHATMAPLSNTYLLYCDCANAKHGKMSICAAVTAGDVDNLMVGRNGVFYDRKGRDFDATVTKIVDNPISIRQAFWSPYKKAIRLVEEQIAKRADAAAARADSRMTAGVEEASTAADTGAPPAASAAAPPAPKKLDIGVVAAIGVAVGGITAALGALATAFFGLGWLMPIGLLAIILAISGPSMAVAWLKLRKRNLGPILDANGWAVNAQAKVNVPLGTSLTELPKLPAGSSRELSDPFAEKKKPWGFYVFLIVLLVVAGAWLIGKLDQWLPNKVRSTSVLGENAPAYVPAPADAGPR